MPLASRSCGAPKRGKLSLPLWGRWQPQADGRGDCSQPGVGTLKTEFKIRLSVRNEEIACRLPYRPCGPLPPKGEVARRLTDEVGEAGGAAV